MSDLKFTTIPIDPKEVTKAISLVTEVLFKNRIHRINQLAALKAVVEAIERDGIFYVPGFAVPKEKQ